ncbi:hydrogenase expression/formation protein HypE [Parapedobacter koreensis]|uniref:Hydrogenase expression/formation protein HypE n=1 Tax=Parapedobacter koreensis TaxID=332977 RepID=A0A1H7TKW8_9SPHI|nr:hydrogenase expression/formation protein HypE [Parapedobacter koreensis]SEL85338.1 hydrogenase expression/formation protein HypE [Parapedobacter koreensis]
MQTNNQTSGIIDLQYGGGGEQMNKLLDDVVFHYLRNDILNVRHDGAFLDLEGRLAFSTDSYVVSPLFFKGGNIGDLAVNGTVNDLAMCGAVPRYLSLAFIIEEGFAMQRFVDIVKSIRMAASHAGVQVVTGDTKVVEHGKGDGIYINTSGIGTLHARAAIGIDNIREGDAVLVNASIATHGMAIMSEREGLQFGSDIVSDTAPLNHTVLTLMERFGGGIRFLRDATRGGLASILHEIATAGCFGIDLVEERLPVLSDVRNACELLGLDPVYVANEGVFICVVPDSIREAVLETLRIEDPAAAHIGTITTDHPGKIISASAFGGRHVVHPLVGEQLPRIC